MSGKVATSGKAMLDRFIDKNPLTVMTRTVVGWMMGEELDGVFEESRSRQYDDTIKFSTLAMSMAEIVLETVDNRNQAYKKYKEELNVTVEAYYGKLNRTEPSVSEAVVRYSAKRASGMLPHLDYQPWEVLPGYRALSIDGNHLQKTEKRLPETRGLCAAPLPGTVVARFDHQTQIFDQAYLLEDAHAQESSVLDRALEDLGDHDLLFADRHFCIVNFMIRLDERDACFVIRQHGRLKDKLLGKRRKVGSISSGNVYEQAMEIHDGERTLILRRVTVFLKAPTRDGDTELHLLSNVPADDANACQLADMYWQRWEIENAFYILTMTLNCEMKSNCHPRCALFQFCMAMVAYNCRQVLLAAMCAEHDEEDVAQMSQYQVAIDMVRPMEGMLTAINEAEWDGLTPSSPRSLAAFLRRVAHHVPIKSYRKTRRGPKKPKPKRKRCKAGTHISTAKLLQARRQSKQRC